MLNKIAQFYRFSSILKLRGAVFFNLFSILIFAKILLPTLVMLQ